MRAWMSVVIVAGLTSATGCCSTAASTDGGGGDANSPDVFTPDAAQPDVSAPDVSTPDVAQPDASTPDVAQPDVTSPDVTSPDVTVSDASDASEVGDSSVPGDSSDASDASDGGDGGLGPALPCAPCVGDGCTIEEVTTGSRFSCARRRSGQVLCWGDNSLGQLGDGTTTSSTRPVAALGICDAVEIEAGSGTACARRRSGQVSCWGSNSSGTLGIGVPFAMMASSTRPLDAMGLGDAVAIEGGAGFFCAIRTGGQVVCWGTNGGGQLGQGAVGSDRPTPIAVPGVADATALSTSQYACAVRTGGAATCWGRNFRGRLGNGAETDNLTASPVVGITDAVGIADGVWHACVLRRDGTVSCWGDNALGTLGTTASAAATLTATAVPGVTGVQQIEVGFRHTCALLRDGTVVCWGKNNLGELGRGAASPFEATPAPVMGLTDVTQISAHSPHDGPVEGGHTCALRRTGAVVCWGKNDLGQLGDGSTMTRAAPVSVSF